MLEWIVGALLILAGLAWALLNVWAGMMATVPQNPDRSSILLGAAIIYWR